MANPTDSPNPTPITHPKSRKPLVYWCRWHNASLRLRGKDEDAVWGQVVYRDKDEDAEDSAEKFHFHLSTWVLTRGEKVAHLDEMGIEVEQ